MLACRNVILSGQRGPQKDAIAVAAFTTPEIRADAATETLYKFVVEAVEGAPTSALLTVAFQAAHRTTGGVVGQGVGQDNFTDRKPVWQTLNSDEHRDLLPDGDWPTLLADQTLAAPVVFFRRIRGGMSHRLLITPTLTGGTTPAFVMSVENEVRY